MAATATLWLAGKNPRTPWYAKALGGWVVAYALSPMELIPDFIPALGYVDDVLLPGLIWPTIRRLPPEVLVDNILGKPSACCDVMAKPMGTQPKVSVTATPKNGKATDHMVRFLAPLFGVTVADMEAVFGHESIHKQLRITHPKSCLRCARRLDLELCRPPAAPTLHTLTPPCCTAFLLLFF